ncbi:hypothetical protein ACJ6WE_04100 [Streptomyces sp. MMS24-I31]|uniref:hypothetical protein n=1 Tax=Streptomyces sp. MMS24-I31 TaxID=3351563 RepID=UPI003896C037
MDRLTAARWTAWRLSLPPSSNGYTKHSTIAGLLQMDPRLARSVREATTKRFNWTPGRDQAYGPEEFQQIKLAARRTFRAALLRIRESTAHLTVWREGRIEAGSTEWLLGEALDVLARTGDVPVYDNPRTVRKRYRRALVGGSAEHTWGLGVHIQVAVQWQKASGGDWAAYAAEVSQRANRAHQQGEDVHASR